MNMAACAYCWDHPCTCGKDYESWPVSGLIKQRDMFQRIIDERAKKAEEGDKQ
jgi:hypothetical protein